VIWLGFGDGYPEEDEEHPRPDGAPIQAPAASATSGDRPKANKSWRADEAEDGDGDDPHDPATSTTWSVVMPRKRAKEQGVDPVEETLVEGDEQETPEARAEGLDRADHRRLLAEPPPGACRSQAWRR